MVSIVGLKSDFDNQFIGYTLIGMCWPSRFSDCGLENRLPTVTNPEAKHSPTRISCENQYQ